MNNKDDDLFFKNLEEKIKGNSSKSKRKKIAIATTASVLAATAIVVPTVLYASNSKFDIEINTNVDIVEEYTTNVKRGMLVKDIKVQEIEGYTFVGFYKDADLTQPYKDNDKVSKNMQIYAKYEINTYSVKFPTSTNFTVEGEGIEDNQANIEYNTEYRFKINLNVGYGESEIIVKANGEIIEPDSDGYYTLIIKENVVIEVDGVETNTYTINEIPTQITIKRNDIILTTKDKVYYGDRLEITYNETVGYNMTEFNVTGATRDDETNFYIVTGDLTVTYSEEIQTFDVTIAVNNPQYGKLNTYSVTVPYGTTYETDGNILTFNDKTNVIAMPFEDTAQYEYTFTGWSSNSGTITAEETITANFNRVTNSYTVTFYDENKTTVLDTLTDEYGTSIIYSGEEPTKLADNTYTYSFECWETADGEEYELSGKTITSDLALYARYSATYIEYDIADIPAQVEIRKGGEELTSSDTLHYGDVVEITYTVTPHYNMTEFEVAGASLLAIHANKYMVTGDLAVIYSEEIQTFTVQWLNYDGTVLETDKVAYGSIPEYNGETPVRESIDKYVYTFTGWSPNITAITSLTSYVAQYRQDEILPFTIENGKITEYFGTDKDIIIPTTYSIASDGTIIVGNNHKVTSIGDYAFLKCSGITNITIPSSVTNLGTQAFSNCTGLKTVTFEENSQLNYIGMQAFSVCTNLTSINIPESVTSIGNFAFDNCPDLANVYYEGTANEWVSITFGNDAANPLYYGANLYINGDELATEINIDIATKINSYAFREYTNLTKVTIGSQVTSIGDSAFEGCTGLTEINYNAVNLDDLSNNNQVFNYAGQDGAGIVFNIGADVTRIPAYLFYTYIYNTQAYITAVNFAENSQCKEIGNNAITRTDITNITIPASVTSIGDYAFSASSNLATVIFEEGSQLESIGDYAFSVSRNLKAVIFEEDSQLESIGNYAFQNCNNLTSITIPASVTSIGERALTGCYSLVYIVNKSALEFNVGDYGTNRNSILEIVSDESEVIFVDIAGNRYKDYNGERYFIKNLDGSSEIEIDSSCTQICQYAFEDCSILTSITVPASVTSIGDLAFDGCRNLATVIFEEGSQLESIGSTAFSGCTGLTSITIPASVTSIEGWAFSGCSNLATVIIEEGSQLESIEIYAFGDCSSLSSITIPASVTSIGDYATFSGCSNLATVIIESNYAYKTATSTSACGNLLQNATEVRVLTSCIGTDTNSYLENTANFTKTTDGEYTVYTKVQ